MSSPESADGEVRAGGGVPSATWSLAYFPVGRRWLYPVATRLLAIAVSAAALLLAGPAMLIIAGYIRWMSKGPALFRQIRVGRDHRRPTTHRAYFEDPRTGALLPERRSGAPAPQHAASDRRRSRVPRYYLCPAQRVLKEDRRCIEGYGRPFVFYKFATMYRDARKRFPDLYAYLYTAEQLQALRFKVPSDPRVPPWAAWLRKSSLDELPNFINVLLGDMNLVGPRPDIPEMVKYYTPEQHRRKLSVKPGMTGLAQIRGRGDLSFQETLAYDLEYVQNRSLRLDLEILWLTFLKLFKGREGAY